MSSYERNISIEIERVLDDAARHIARQNAEFSEVLSESELDPSMFAKVTGFRPKTPKSRAVVRQLGARG